MRMSSTETDQRNRDGFGVEGITCASVVAYYGNLNGGMHMKAKTKLEFGLAFDNLEPAHSCNSSRAHANTPCKFAFSARPSEILKRFLGLNSFFTFFPFFPHSSLNPPATTAAQLRLPAAWHCYYVKQNLHSLDYYL